MFFERVEMIKIQIIRKWQAKTCVIGELEMFKDDSSVFKCYCLEEDREGFESGQDLRIPEGDYNLKPHSPSRFENTLREITGDNSACMACVYNDKVPSSRAILIHWGNTEIDTQGCILLGYNKGGDNESIVDSRHACADFYKHLSGVDLTSVKLNVKNNIQF